MMIETDGQGGAEVVTFQLSEELRRRGHEVIAIGPEKGAGWLRERFTSAGFTREAFRLRSALDYGCALHLAETFRRHRIDLVHSHEFTMGVYGTLATRMAALPHVITLHGSAKMCRALRRRVAIRWAMRRSSAAVACSFATRDSLVADLGVASDSIRVVQNGVPVVPGDGARIRREFGIGRDELVVLAVGSLEPRKGHRLLLQALSELEREGVTPWRLIVAGGRGGPEHEPLLALAREAGIADRVHVVLRRDDVSDLQAAADIFAMPSLWEGLPMAMLEAMAAGKAVIASRTAGIPEAISDDEHGLLVPPGEVPPLREGLRRLLADPLLRARFGTAARERAERHFTLAAMTSGYESVYRGGLQPGVDPSASAPLRQVVST